MRNWILTLFIALPLGAQNNAVKPKLVVAIVIDQFRYDYLTRFHSEYTGGFKRFFEHGAVFTNAHYEHVPTVTAVGHSTFLSGATPAMSGIIGNDWWDRATKKRVTSVSDGDTKLLGAEGEGSSPNRLLQSTVGDEMKMSGKGGKVIGVSIKDRAAILPSGHMADGAYWFDGKTGNFVSSTFYFAALPEWVAQFNASRPADKYVGKTWMGKTMAAKPDAKFYAGLDSTPYGNELILQFAEKAIACGEARHGSEDRFADRQFFGQRLRRPRAGGRVGRIARHGSARRQAGGGVDSRSGSAGGRGTGAGGADGRSWRRAGAGESIRSAKCRAGDSTRKAELDAVEKALTGRFGAPEGQVDSDIRARARCFSAIRILATSRRWSASPPTRFARCRMCFASTRARS